MASSGLDLFPVSLPPDLAGLARGMRKEVVVGWFADNFEDPAESTPYESAEGGYQWIWGGPYDAREEIEGAFDLSDRELEAILEEIESNGTLDWAPHINRIRPVEDDRDEEPDREDLRILLTQLRGEIQSLRGIHDELRNRPIGMGHNGPPDDDELVPTLGDLDETEAAIGALEVQLDVLRPDRALVAEARTKFTEIAVKVRSWLGKLPGWVTEGAVKGAAGAVAGLGVKHLIEHPEKFADMCEQVSWMIGAVF